MERERTYVCIDLKSFYASVECVRRGLDPMTTRLVVADPTRSEMTICLVLALPQNQPNAPLYPAGGAPGSRPGALPHFGRPRYLGPPPRARSTAG